MIWLIIMTSLLVIDYMIHKVYYQGKFLNFFHFLRHTIPWLDNSLYVKQDHIVISEKHRVAGQICQVCGHVRGITKRFYGKDSDGWAKRLCESMERQRFDNLECGGDVVLPDGIKPWD